MQLSFLSGPYAEGVRLTPLYLGKLLQNHAVFHQDPQNWNFLKIRTPFLNSLRMDLDVIKNFAAILNLCDIIKRVLCTVHAFTFKSSRDLAISLYF